MLDDFVTLLVISMALVTWSAIKLVYWHFFNITACKCNVVEFGLHVSISYLKCIS